MQALESTSHHFHHHSIVYQTSIPAERRRPSCTVGSHLDYLVPVMDCDDAPTPPGEDDRHANCQERGERKRSERLAVGDDPVFLGRLEYGIEAMVLDQPLTLATKKKNTVGGLLDQPYVGPAELSEKASKKARVDVPKRSLFAENGIEAFRLHATMFDDHGKDLMCECGEMKCMWGRRFTPSLDQQLDHRDRADET